jgi:regulator of protease activity HflC (stomatin/prohibitin superfamily)
MEAIREFKSWKCNGFAALLVSLIVIAAEVLLFRAMVLSENLAWLWLVIPVFLVIIATPNGFTIVQPNEARVLVFLGRYAGSVRDAGFWWVNPFTTKKVVSLRIHNLNSDRIKVNDLSGNPIEIAAVVVWRVVDTAKATFDVADYKEFVTIQNETAIRTLASLYPYDAHDETKVSLRGSPNEVSENLRAQVQARLEIAGVEVSEARISHLAYAPEIAQVMLRRQQAEAIVAARQKLVEGAVGMVKMALTMLADEHVVELDEEKRASMTNNLLVALVSEHETTPVINTGTLYS